jgi:hypothetical protein
MRLDRTAGNGTGKYAVVRLRKVDAAANDEAHASLNRLAVGGFVEFGRPGDDEEFFVIKLKDRYAESALRAYAMAAFEDDPEYAEDIMGLARRAATHPQRKKPD